jgi:sulfite exporter TauE/SafE
MVVLWFIASLSTCLALVGGFVLMRWSVSWAKNKSLYATLYHQGVFQWGRLLWFAIWWALLWFLGSTIIFSPLVNWIINLLVSILLLMIWRNMLLIFPLRVPTRWGGAWVMTLLEGVATKKWWWLFVWALTFFLPCWFSQLAQINALSTADPLQWWILMFLFAVGTFPILFLLWVTGNRFHMNPSSFPAKLIGVLLVVLSMFLIQNALRLLGWF